MMRRKLVVYTLMLIAGISAGYFILEKIRLICGTVFLFTMGVAVVFMDERDNSEKKRINKVRGGNIRKGRPATEEFTTISGGHRYIGIKIKTAGAREPLRTEKAAAGEFRIERQQEKKLRTEKLQTEKLKIKKIICFCIMLMGFILFAGSYAYYESSVREGAEISVRGRVINAEDRRDYLRLTIKDCETSRKLTANISKDEKESADIAYYIGSEASICGEVREIAEADNPGCFDYRRYMRSKDISFSVKADSVIINNEEPSTIWRIRKRLIRARERFLSYFDDETSALIRGVIFGDKSEIDENVLREFNINSAGHILAVSGLHIGFLHSLLKLLSARRKTLPASILIILITTMYGEMTMWSSSTIRAVIVLSLSILSVNLRRSFDLMSSLAAAAFVILTVRPYMLFNSGFQLSFAAMCSIALLSKYLSAFLGKTLGAAVSVQIGTIPLIATGFHRVNVLSALINIPIILLSSLLVPVCILSLFLSMITGTLPDVCVVVITFSCNVLTDFNHALSFDGGFSMLSSGLATSRVIAYYIFAFMTASEWLRVNVIRRNYSEIKKACCLVLVLLMFVHLCLYDSFKNDEVVFVSVGQGDCTHIRCGSEDVIIDGGGSDYVNTGERTLMPYLLSQGAKDVDVALLTHLHKDHYLGVSELSEIYPVNAVAIPADYRPSFENSRSADKAGKNDEHSDYGEIGDSGDHVNNEISFNTARIVYLDKSSRIKINDDVYIEVLWPTEGVSGGISIDDPNEHNMVYMIHYRGCRIMVTGDLLEEDEIKMVAHYRGGDALKCDILKVAHHGSKSSSSEEFLDAASPGIAVIQVGRRNMYGHPHEQTLKRLSERGITIYRTDLNGAIGIDIKRRGGLSVDLFRRTDFGKQFQAAD